MKTKIISFLLLILISAIGFLTFSAFNSKKGLSVHSMGGQASSTGSPGELGTCSRSGCHGAGNGGLADNAGPGSVTITSFPAMLNGNQYVGGQTYTMTVTVSETGKPRFGFACEILDNSGSTNGHINNTAGTITVIDHINTRTWQAFGTGRLAITQDTNGGFSNNTSSFIFAWTAPASNSPSYGTVNMYLCGNAANGNLTADAPDNVYAITKQLTPDLTDVSNLKAEISSVNIYPNPSCGIFMIVNDKEWAGQQFQIEIYNVAGENIYQSEMYNSKSVIDLSAVPCGVYFVKLRTSDGLGNYNEAVKKIVVSR